MSIFSYKNLYTAYLDCRKNKRNTLNALRFEIDLELNLQRLLRELRNKTYYPGKSICFAVNEPSKREIFAADFRDRVVHHLLINELLGAGERNFIFDSYACRKNKGTHRAVQRLKEFVHKITRNGRDRAYFLKLDISSFFMNINKEILFILLVELVAKQKRSHSWKDEILWLGEIVIFYNPTENYCAKGDLEILKSIPKHKSLFGSTKEKGLPIGNYSSQFFANLYMNQLDHFVKRELKARYYLRYVDDFILLDKDIKKLKKNHKKIDYFLKEKIEMKLNEKKTKLARFERGIDFLGYFIKPDYVLVRQKVVSRFKLKTRGFEKGKLDKFQKSVVSSYFGHFSFANSKNLIREIDLP